MDQVLKKLVAYLAAKGMAEDEISTYICSVWDTFSLRSVKSCDDLNFHMQTFGWTDLKLGEDDFKIFSEAFTDYT